MNFESKYKSKMADNKGIYHYTEEENKTWAFLYRRQINIIKNRACSQFLQGLELLNLDEKHVPQNLDVNQKLMQLSGWSVSGVEALISYEYFFELIANKQFPAATFIRHWDEVDYLEEPDIFHELFGHCPMLTHQIYADFMAAYGKKALEAKTEEEFAYFARLYWFTVEFGLIKTKQGLRSFGGGILSSKQETIYATDSDVPTRKPLNLDIVLRTPYRIDILQPTFFYINDFKELFELTQLDLISMIHQAQDAGDFAVSFA